MLKKNLLAGSAAESFVGVYHYRVTPVYWNSLVSQSDTANYGFVNEYGPHGSVEALDMLGDSASLSAFFYTDTKIKNFFLRFGDKTPYSGVIEINGEKRAFDNMLSLPGQNDDGTWIEPHDIIRPACTSGKQFDLRIYVSLWYTSGES